jgi:hypothetical protein
MELRGEERRLNYFHAQFGAKTARIAIQKFLDTGTVFVC